MFKKGVNDMDNDGVVTHLEPDILECEVKWALVQTVELFQILKDDTVKVLHWIS